MSRSSFSGGSSVKDRPMPFLASLSRIHIHSTRLNKDDKEIINPKQILKNLSPTMSNYIKIKKIDTKKIEQFNKNINIKLPNDENNSIEGPVTEYECVAALKATQNNKSPGSDGITTEFYKIFWREIKSYYV